ncbi:hypothetical protein F383_23423 [Gossypium arboreum]|nr:hypothetical protein F383_23423 [Gossypium arboreum]
MCLSRV